MFLQSRPNVGGQLLRPRVCSLTHRGQDGCRSLIPTPPPHTPGLVAGSIVGMVGGGGKSAAGDGRLMAPIPVPQDPHPLIFHQFDIVCAAAVNNCSPCTVMYPFTISVQGPLVASAN